MAHYLVRARPAADLSELCDRLENHEISQLRPFGSELQQCLHNARIDSDGWALWEENCYCDPPLKQERSVIDQYFTNLTTETINKGDGWAQINELPSLWVA